MTLQRRCVNKMRFCGIAEQEEMGRDGTGINWQKKGWWERAGKGRGRVIECEDERGEGGKRVQEYVRICSFQVSNHTANSHSRDGIWEGRTSVKLFRNVCVSVYVWVSVMRHDRYSKRHMIEWLEDKDDKGWGWLLPQCNRLSLSKEFKCCEYICREREGGREESERECVCMCV